RTVKIARRLEVARGRESARSGRFGRSRSASESILNGRPEIQPPREERSSVRIGSTSPPALAHPLTRARGDQGATAGRGHWPMSLRPMRPPELFASVIRAPETTKIAD